MYEGMLAVETNVHTVSGLLIFATVGGLVVLGALLLGKVIRPKAPNPEKGDTYECGEKTIGPSWVQFDLRFYVLALVFIIFDVEIALFYPWAVIYKSAGAAALWDMLFFFGVLVAGFLYLWRHGYLDWVRAVSHGRLGDRAERIPGPPPTEAEA